jgi:glycosyltransferase involved in cell wall biosynthesis
MEIRKTADDDAAARWPVMVLAHNEERHIAKCLDSIVQAERPGRFSIFVMANGCTDGTENVVRAYSKTVPEVKLVTIELGDKCNAWNVFIHETVPTFAPDSDVYFFMDGDARATPGSFTAMHRALGREPHAHAASAPPVSGRSVEHDREELLTERGLVANLYSLRGSFVRRLQAMGVRIPLKLEGDDGLIGALIKWDLDPQHNQYDHQRIVPCADAGFAFESMSLTRPKDWIGYWKRAVRYGRRQYEFQLLGSVLKEKGVAGLPRVIDELYTKADSLPLRKAGIYTITNWFALQQMRRVGRTG